MTVAAALIIIIRIRIIRTIVLVGVFFLLVFFFFLFVTPVCVLRQSQISRGTMAVCVRWSCRRYTRSHWGVVISWEARLPFPPTRLDFKETMAVQADQQSRCRKLPYFPSLCALKIHTHTSDCLTVEIKHGAYITTGCLSVLGHNRWCVLRSNPHQLPPWGSVPIFMEYVRWRDSLDMIENRKALYFRFHRN